MNLSLCRYAHGNKFTSSSGASQEIERLAEAGPHNAEQRESDLRFIGTLVVTSRGCATRAVLLIAACRGAPAAPRIIRFHPLLMDTSLDLDTSRTLDLACTLLAKDIDVIVLHGRCPSAQFHSSVYISS
jgi:hypothetical protein